MADPKRALVLHLSNGGEPLVFALSEEGERELDNLLHNLLATGQVYSPTLADGTKVFVNFSHVVTAHLDELPPLARVYGSGQPKRHGFAT
ncbi:hypothetical protein [Actinophytocola sp.]|jgi:hypothetical protein|uniref:hypothetical protein n=1 Tax=Actinophytocola sp. TaxID=1872138 RepID=UPI002EDA530E